MKLIKRFAVFCVPIFFAALMTWACTSDVNEISPVPSSTEAEDTTMPIAETVDPTAATANPTADLPVITSFEVTDRVMPTDLTYLGSFRLPGGEDPPQTFAYGGNAMTFNPDGPNETASTLPGSLFISGHDRMAYGYLPDGDQIAEVNISFLPLLLTRRFAPGRAIQNFADVTALFCQSRKFPRWYAIPQSPRNRP